MKQARALIQEPRDHVNTSNFRTSTILALERMEVPIEFAEMRYHNILEKLPEQSSSQSLSDYKGRFKRFIEPITAAFGVGASIIGWFFEFFKAKEFYRIREDMHQVKDNIYKLADNKKFLFATTVRHQEMLVDHSLLWVRNNKRWTHLYTVDQAAALTKWTSRRFPPWPRKK